MRNFLLLTLCFFICYSCDKEANHSNVFTKGKKVLVIGIDGCRSDMITPDITPFMNSLIRKSSVAYNLEHKIESLTFSGPNWASICTGVHFEKHNVTTNGFENNALENYPHFFKHINDYYGDEQTNLISYAAWFPINYFMNLYIADHGPVKFDYTDQEVFDLSKATLENNEVLDPDVLFVHLDQMDHAGHSHGFHPDSSHYVEAAGNVDEYVEDFYELVETRKQANNEDWLIIIVSDHGGEDYGHSGGANNPNISNTILFLDNDAISNEGQLVQSEQVDIAPTVLKFLGVDIDEIDLDGINLLKF